jgi:hypothetical protein
VVGENSDGAQELQSIAEDHKVVPKYELGVDRYANGNGRIGGLKTASVDDQQRRAGSAGRSESIGDPRSSWVPRTGWWTTPGGTVVIGQFKDMPRSAIGLNIMRFMQKPSKGVNVSACRNQ